MHRLDPERLVRDNWEWAMSVAQFLWNVDRHGRREHDERFHSEADFYSDVAYGLWRAARRYDPAKNADFRRYAWLRIRGTVQHYVRQRDVVGRTDAQWGSRIERVKRERFAGREPSESELAEALGVDESYLLALRRRYSTAHAIYAFEAQGEEHDPVEAIADPTAEAQLRAVEEDHTLVDALTTLPERERFIVGLFYWHDCSLREIGEMMGISDSRVCQLKQRGLDRLADSYDLTQEAA